MKYTEETLKVFFFGLSAPSYGACGSLPGTLVPSATKAMAVTESLSPTEQPKAEATSPMTAVRIPIHTIDITKQSQPPNRSTVVEREKWRNPQGNKKKKRRKQPNPEEKIDVLVLFCFHCVLRVSECVEDMYNMNQVRRDTNAFRHDRRHLVDSMLIVDVTLVSSNHDLFSDATHHNNNHKRTKR